MESNKSCSTATVSHQGSQVDDEIEGRIFSICAKAGVSCIGIQRGFGISPDIVLFQPTVTTLAIPLAEFAKPERAVEAIRAKLAKAGFLGGLK